jgi:hypothetical protein
MGADVVLKWAGEWMLERRVHGEGMTGAQADGRSSAYSSRRALHPVVE